MTLRNSILSLKDEFLNLIEAIKATGIAKRLYSAKNESEIKIAWVKFLRDNSELISRVKEWEKDYIANHDLNKLYSANEKIEDAIEIAICIRLMSTSGMEILIFEDENDLSDALGRIENIFAKNVARLSYDHAIKNIKVKDIAKR